MIDDVADDEGREDEPACQSCDEHQEGEVGHRDQEHPGPDVQNHCRQLRVWVGFVFWPQNQVRPRQRKNVKFQMSQGDLERQALKVQREEEDEKNRIRRLNERDEQSRISYERIHQRLMGS